MNEKDNWFYKYSPKNLSEMCLTSKQREVFKHYIEEKNVPHIILYGTPGIGKTTLYTVLKNELIASGEIYNGSTDRSITLLRDEIPQLLSKVCFSDNYEKRIIFIDEFENISKDAMLALKGTIDTYNDNATFIFSTNTISNVIEPILDRCVAINLVPHSIEEKKELMLEYARRGMEILKAEKVEFNVEVLKIFLKRCYPSMRKFIKSLQIAAAKYKKITKEVLEDEAIFTIEKLIECIKTNTNANWNEMRRIVEGMSDFENIYREVFAKIEFELHQDILRKVVKVVHEYSYKSEITKNKEITVMAFFTDLMEVINGRWLSKQIN